ncbi:methyltransferase domain-containing protein, partial [Agrococcus sp. HG114]|uniref:methyltransferase domain-containing protein n=1 Tax=Agrococcus sp. HG114 TaxID=2969757 RepID=UPI00215B0409
MDECRCEPDGYAAEFDAAFAERMARRYRRRGLTRPERRLVDYLASDDIRGASVLEIGGGVGEIGIELLRRGAAGVTTLELSAAYDEQAGLLAAEAGVSDRVQRRIIDLAEHPAAVEPADLVVLHRVVCCYPDFERLLTAAADRCRARLAFTHPRRDPVTRAVCALETAASRRRGSGFRSYLHPPAAMVRAVEARGLRAELRGRGLVWQVQG